MSHEVVVKRLSKEIYKVTKIIYNDYLFYPLHEVQWQKMLLISFFQMSAFLVVLFWQFQLKFCPFLVSIYLCLDLAQL
jgi:hypothetical protein